MKARKWVWPLKAEGTRIIDATSGETGIYSSYETEQDEYGFEKSSTYDECCKHIQWIVECMNKTFKIESEAINVGG